MLKYLIRLLNDCKNLNLLSKLLEKNHILINNATLHCASQIFKTVANKYLNNHNIKTNSLMLSLEELFNTRIGCQNKNIKMRNKNNTTYVDQLNNFAKLKLRKHEDMGTEIIKRLRKISRQTYLKKREHQKLEELQKEVEDEERLFLASGVHLSHEESKALEYNREMLNIAIARNKILEELENIDAYHMPDPHKSSELNLYNNDKNVFKNLKYKKYNTDMEENKCWSEQEKWEAEQFRKTYSKSGPDRLHTISDHTMIIEDQINFINTNLITLKSSNFPTPVQSQNLGHKKRESLPMFPHKKGIVDALEKYNILIIEAETGSGKTTQIPQYLNEAGYTKTGKIGCTQPRRIAAMSVAGHVAKEMNVQVGREVGYSIRFEDCTSHKTIIKYMTDGILLREFLSEPDLVSYSVVILDEAHERTLHTDILFGLVKDVTKFRTNLRLIISSATLDATKFSDFFDDAPIYKVPGGMFPVEVLYTKTPEANYLEAVVKTTLQIHLSEPLGDILIFLVGQEEIEKCGELIEEKIKGMGTKIAEIKLAPIYANMPSELQANIFDSTAIGTRKVVIATNIAESSLTINGIKYVIDPGFVKQNSYNPKTGVESLLVIPISQASAKQRAGRAGRTSPGKCYRLYTKWAFENDLELNNVPEIQRTNLANMVLITKSLGINDVISFDFMDPPPVETLIRSFEQLYALGALNDLGELTKLGRRMAEFPSDPQLAKMLIISEKYKVAKDVATIAAMVSCGGSVFYRPKDRFIQADTAHKNFHRGNIGDHIALMRVYNDWEEVDYAKQFCYDNFIQVRTMKRARDVRDQIIGLMERVDIDFNINENDVDSIRKCITAGYFHNVARLCKEGSYQAIKNPTPIYIHPSSGLRDVTPQYVVYHELVFTSKEFMRTVSEIQPDWLFEIAPHMFFHFLSEF